MSTMSQVREGLNEAWDALSEGWQRLYRSASGAMTRFTVGKGGKEKREDSGERREMSARNSGWGLLAAEVFDDDERVVVRLEAPGMEKRDFDIHVMDHHLVVRGEKRIDREHSEGEYHVSECAYGAFRRLIPLVDEVDASRARATYSNGVLRVELPKAVPGRRKQILVPVR